jgi:FkbM family methyltransferase
MIKHIGPFLSTLNYILQHPLNTSHKVTALFTFVKWQIGSRLVPGPVLYTWVDDSQFVVSPGEQGLTGNIYCGLHEFESMAYVLHSVNSEDVFVDIGANVGSYTILACAVKKAIGYCFEPVPGTYMRLLKNIHLNNLQVRVHCFNVGIAEQDGALKFTSSSNTMNHIIHQDETSKDIVSVPTMRLDSILNNVNPTFLKIDVEGYETGVINGAEKVLASSSLHSIIIELNGSGRKYGFDDDKLVQQISYFGFAPYKYDPFTRQLVKLTGKNHANENTLFIRGEEGVKARIQAAPKITVHGMTF